MLDISNGSLIKYEGTDAKLVIPPTVDIIGKGVFYGCELLKSVHLLKTVQTIGDDAFGECSSLTIYCEHDREPDDWARRRFGRWNSARRPVYWGISPKALVEKDGCQFIASADGGAILTRYIGDKSTLIVPSSVEIGGKTLPVTEIGRNSLENSVELLEITVPTSVKKIGDSAFENCMYLIISVAAPQKPEGWQSEWNCGCPVVWNCAENKAADNGFVYFTAADGNRYAVKDNKATFVLFCGSETDYSVPESVGFEGSNYAVTCVGSYAFYFSQIKRAVLPNGITEIGFGAFKDCRQMEEILLPPSVTKIVDYAFSQCISLKTVDLPLELLDLGEAAFERCYELTSVSMQNKLKTIRARAFGECRSLTEASVPDSVKLMGGAVFEYCVAAEKIKLSRNVSEIKFSMFSHCRSLKTVVLPAFPELIEEYAFCGCCSLTGIILGRTVAVVGDYVFKGCKNMTISTELPKKPSAWAQTWNIDERPVVWGYKPF